MYLTAPSNKVVELLEASITVSGTTNQQLEANLQRVSSLGTPTATTVTPSPTEAGDQSASSTVKGNVTASEPTYSSGVTFGQMQFSSLGGWYFQPLPEDRPVVAGGASIGLQLLSTPSSADFDINLVFREIG